MLVQRDLPSHSVLSLTVVLSVGSLFPVCNLYFYFFLTSLGQQSFPPSSDPTTVVSLFTSIQQKWACFRFYFTKIQFGPTIDPPPSNSLLLSLRSFLPYTELVFRSSRETCSLSCTSFVFSGTAEEAVTHLLRLKEMLVSIDLQETFLPRGHALQPQRWLLIFVLLQSV